MDREGIVRALERAEKAVSEGKSLDGTGFWRAVAQARSDRTIADEYAERMAAIDRRAFEHSVWPTVPFGVGTIVMGSATVAALAVLLWSQQLESRLLRTLALLGSFGVLDVSTHSLAHWVVGRLVGIRFTHFFLNGPLPPFPGAKVDYASYLQTPPFPGAKIDYASYLQTPPLRRALMHASGAVVTKLIPFALIPVALRSGVYRWAVYVLIGVGLFQIVTDILFSTKKSDWKKVKRELRASREWSAA